MVARCWVEIIQIIRQLLIKPCCRTVLHNNQLLSVVPEYSWIILITLSSRVTIYFKTDYKEKIETLKKSFQILYQLWNLVYILPGVGCVLVHGLQIKQTGIDWNNFIIAIFLKLTGLMVNVVMSLFGKKRGCFVFILGCVTVMITPLISNREGYQNRCSYCLNSLNLLTDVF